MAKKFEKSFLNSKKWLRCRDSYIQERIMIDGGMCEVCHEKPGYILHHKVTLTPLNISDPDVSLNHELLRWECKDCHDEEEGHFIDGKKHIKKLCVFTEDGQPVSIRKIDLNGQRV